MSSASAIVRGNALDVSITTGPLGTVAA